MIWLRNLGLGACLCLLVSSKQDVRKGTKIPILYGWQVRGWREEAHFTRPIMDYLTIILNQYSAIASWCESIIGENPTLCVRVHKARQTIFVSSRTALINHKLAKVKRTTTRTTIHCHQPKNMMFPISPLSNTAPIDSGAPIASGQAIDPTKLIPKPKRG